MTTPPSHYVLLVDDDPDIRSTVEMALDLYGYTVVSVAGGAEALAWLRGGNTPPFLILLDFMMPGMSGSQFRAEQQRDPALAVIPTVVLTGAGALSDASADVLAAEILPKPIGLERLLDTVERHARMVK
jgi:CheY-like chemotaxis protein